MNRFLIILVLGVVALVAASPLWLSDMHNCSASSPACSADETPSTSSCASAKTRMYP
jgi:hypothetical protein